jgi:hypothetical protein
MTSDIFIHLMHSLFASVNIYDHNRSLAVNVVQVCFLNGRKSLVAAVSLT